MECAIGKSLPQAQPTGAVQVLALAMNKSKHTKESMETGLSWTNLDVT